MELDLIARLARLFFMSSKLVKFPLWSISIQVYLSDLNMLKS